MECDRFVNIKRKEVWEGDGGSESVGIEYVKLSLEILVKKDKKNGQKAKLLRVANVNVFYECIYIGPIYSS